MYKSDSRGSGNNRLITIYNGLLFIQFFVLWDNQNYTSFKRNKQYIYYKDYRYF